MFRPVPMQQISAVVLEPSQRAVLKDWGRLGAVQLLPQPAGFDASALLPRDNSAERAHCERLLGGIEKLRQALGYSQLTRQGSGASPKATGSEILAEERETELTLEEAEQRLRALEARAAEWIERRERLSQRWAELTALDQQVASYCGLELPLDEPDRFDFLHFVTGTLPAGKLEQLQLADNVALLPLGQEEVSGPTGPGTHPGQKRKRQPLVAITTHQGRAALDQALAQAGFEPERLPAIAGTTADSLSERNRREEASLAAELQQVEEQVHQLAAEVAPALAALERGVQLERRLLEAEQQAPRTEAAVVLSGWVPAAEAPALEARVRQITGNRCVIERAAAEQVPEEQVPVLLHHARLLRPFELLVRGYGLPTYRELEPTFFVALSFVLMFGMMFGDAGQGAVLAGAGLMAWRLGRSAKVREVGLLLVFGGLASIGFGLLYGSYFGLPGLKRYALWRDPLEGDPMGLMRGALGMGVVLLSLGVLLNVVNRFRRGDLLGGFLDKFGVLGVLFYWGMLALLTHYAAVQSRGLVHQALLLFLVLPLVGWTLKGPLEYARSHRRAAPGSSSHAQPPGGLWAALAESLVEAFEGLLSYLANTISFVRLAAYALSHAALLVATFMLAAQVQRASAAGSVLIIILGNVVAMVLEGVIASVQALRLEYYEFFSKFFSGAGRAFEPFQLTSEAEAL